MFKGERCFCISPGVKAVRVADIEKVSVFYPSNNCDKTEVIIAMKTHKRQRCLNPRSKQAHIIIKAMTYSTMKRSEKRGILVCFVNSQ
ncbi:C-X-C motif chemokine 11 [Rhinolophus sinicus]|uniref:C-X-C motif chemokine 11 n=1 Tax=Rhinolophus sinicus TaxID=89399 RepID=UPI003D7B374E